MSFFDYPVLTEEEAQKAKEFPLLPPGIYDFVVIEAKFKRSNNNNPMIELKLQIIHEGKQFNVFDNLIGTPNMTWKTIHFCRTTGLEKEYNDKQFDYPLCPRRRGTCAIGLVEARPKNDGTFNPDGTPAMYKAKNEVVDYLSPDKLMTQQSQSAGVFVPPEPKQPAAPAPEAEPFINDEIPF